MTNQLAIGSHRTGSLVDFDPDTPEVQVTLERTEEDIFIHVPWGGADSPYASWFLEQDWIKGTENASRPVPKQLFFSDGNGSVLLVGCRKSTYQTHLFGPGTGQVAAEFAILINPGQHFDFEKVHGLTSEVSGLRSWLGVTNLRMDHGARFGGESRDYDAAYFVNMAPSIEVLSDGQLSFDPRWHQNPSEVEDGVLIHDQVYCRSRSEEPVAWEVLRRGHLALRDLMIFSRWVRASCEVRSVMRLEDPLTTMDGKAHGQQWRDVIQARTEEAESPSIYQRPHIIRYEEIGVEGIKRWLTLRDQFARALDPVISSRFMDRVTPMALLAQTGPGMEALGYLLLRKDGLSETQARNVSLADRLRRIVDNLADTLPFEAEDFVVRAASVYNGIKHANRGLPPEIDMLNIWREFILLVRGWIAIELGVPADKVKERLAQDPQAHPWVPVG